MTDESVIEIPLYRIKTNGRHRKDYGDIAGLAASIEQLGLLQPIGVTLEYPDYRLVFGHRRLLAFKHLGRTHIPVREIDVPALVLAEHAENEIRKDFTVSERVAIGKAVEAELGKRQGQRTDLANEGQESLLELPSNLKEVKGKETAQIAAEKAGFGSANTYRDAKAVTEHAAPELVTAMDQGKVAISTAAKLATAPAEVQREAVADPKKAVELAKAASQQKAAEIKTAAVAIQKSEMQTEMAAMRALRPARDESAPPPEPSPRDPVFDTVLPNGRNIGDGDPKALWLWGWLLEYEDRFLSCAPDPEDLASNFLEFMEKDSRRLIPQVTRYLSRLMECIHHVDVS
ncbi:MAG TPA: ParB N-terminal domain-containing protein [Candidatus Competibacteraceae bacterium]|nr:ParB N-terminal domain-containing protein [Candidatus Competibacteraceae bacterium]